MEKYKIIALSQRLTLKSLVERSTEQLNEYADDGWEVVQMRHGWSGFFFSSLYILLEKNNCELDDEAIKRVAKYKNFEIVQFKTNKIIVLKNDKQVTSALAELKIIAEELDLPIVSERSGNSKNSRQLGKEVIDAIKGL